MNICDNSLFIYPDTVFRRQMEQALPHRYSGVILAGCYIHLHYICLLFPYTHQCLKQKKNQTPVLYFIFTTLTERCMSIWMTLKYDLWELTLT